MMYASLTKPRVFLMSTWMTALQAEIDSKKAELTKLEDVQKKIASLAAEISHLEGILANASKPPKAVKTKSASVRTWTAERRARHEATLAAKKDAGVALGRPKKA